MKYLAESYCLLTGGRCTHSPIHINPNTFFISEPYDEERIQRENSIIEAIKGYKYVVSDHNIMNVSVSCKICHQIQTAQFGIVDITTGNKNVLIELGMLYGFNKPVIVLVKHTSKIKMDIPSNIVGIEQIRYKDFVDLEAKLKGALTALFDISIRQSEYLLDLGPALKHQIEQIELGLVAKRLDGVNFKGELQSLLYLNATPTVIINKGSQDGICNNLVFSVISLETQIGDDFLEHEVGRLVVSHVQEKIAQCLLLSIDPNNSFWRDFMENGKAPPNLIKPFVTEPLRRLSELELRENLSKLKILLDGYTIKVRE